ncbi:hypothetical protein ASPWEDRAFT_22965 [Aspergillus wentii DTO 134E9]|uniref:F-box domain-containing protein n=1 Tax=Aspergillus wentii DTO 134E9 TaxID=1073089 RepID=A0A1L9S111_ASPWE|nr:uncharacterized protein ASPWEDRAFT_22965 [Aspergillus wentii DTO 134E9]KAI9931175.1 hypothetical protein MW887_010834 [Aspergillus wentii]OJJ40818.1 hypothetical protein ASPWEDRAFT_22965 [Aspergillus wentii DTO 134E9]
MATPALKLGAFGRLPYELRLQIWKQLLPALYMSDHLAILRTNKSIYDEITNQLYDTFDIHISPSLRPWIVIRSRQLQAEWTIDGENDWRCAVFKSIPFHKINLAVHIEAPHPEDPGQLILLWKKVNVLVEVLWKSRSPFKSIDLVFEKSHDIDWQTDGESTKSIEHIRGGLPDHDIVFMPFCLLAHVEEFDITPSSHEMEKAIDWGFLNYGCEFIRNNGYSKGNHTMYNSDPEYEYEVCAFDDIDALAADLNFSLDVHLDDVPGPTANKLRLKRFAKYFVDGDKGESPYMQFILGILRHYPEIVRRRDIFLYNLFNRHEILLRMHEDICDDELSLRHTWNQKRWYQRFPNGIPPLSMPDLVEQGYISDKPLDPSELSSRFVEFLGAVQHWVSNMWRKSFNTWPGLVYCEDWAQEWCEDCQVTGLTFGCSDCIDLEPVYDYERSEGLSE